MDCGLPWRDMPGKLYCRCDNSEIEAIELSPCKPGLGQGFRIAAPVMGDVAIYLHYFNIIGDILTL